MKNQGKKIFSSLLVWIVTAFFLFSIAGLFFGNYFTNYVLTSKRSVDARNFSENIIGLYYLGDYKELTPYYGKILNKDNEKQASNVLHSFFPSPTPDSIKLVGANYYKDLSEKNISKVTADLEYQFNNKWFLVRVMYVENEAKKTLSQVIVWPLPGALEKINRVSLMTASLKQWCSLILLFILPVIVIFSLIKYCRTNKLKRKWLWILFIAFGFCSFKFNWTTQEFVFHPVSLQLFGVSYFRASKYSPLVMSFSIPLGAILFLIIDFFKKNKGSEVTDNNT